MLRAGRSSGMNSLAARRAATWAMAAACVLAVLGCEVIAKVDRHKIPSETSAGGGGTGGAAAGQGGTAGASTGGSGGTAGTGGMPQCQVASDCPGMDTDCQKRACSSGTCSVTNV